MTMSRKNSKFEMRNSKLSSGAAIMLALWALFLLSAMIISWALDINSRLTLSGNGTRMLKAEAAACSGAEIALHPLVNPGSQSLVGIVGDGATYESRMTGEAGRLDINWLVAGEDPKKLEILKRYLENKGIDLNERDAMVDALLDWVEPNTGLHRLNAPPESDTYHPPHAPLVRVDELKRVAGWGDFTSAPGWDDDFTVNSRSGVDLAWASRDVLLALPGMTPDVVDRFLQVRQGPDGIDGTPDDAQFKGLDDVRTALGLNQDQFNQLQTYVTFKLPIYRAVSVGSDGNAKRTVQMVFRRQGAVPQLISWKEF
jgi:general secretion pathway protein K